MVTETIDRQRVDKLWDKSPLLPHCRGLILNASGDILARPFPKFFNE